MPGRKFSAGSGYRYGFNGKENDNEVKGEGNQQDYGFRVYDTRLGRFLSVDPLEEEYPELTTYQFSSNDPIRNIDLDGLEGSDYTGRFTNATPEQRELAPVWSFFRDLSADMLNLTPFGKADDLIANWKSTSNGEKIYRSVDILTTPLVPFGGSPKANGKLNVSPNNPKAPLKGNVQPANMKATAATAVNSTNKQVTTANQKNTNAAHANSIQNNQKLGRAPSSEILDNNLKVTGIKRPANHAAHHTVPGNDPRGQVSRSILQREGIDINEAANGVYLPANSKYASPPATIHSKVHTNLYYSELEKRLKAAQPGKIRNELKKINSELQKGTFPY